MDDNAIRTSSKFKQMVYAVYEIIQRKLYKTLDMNVETYFKRKWGISRAQVYRFHNSAMIIKELEEFPIQPSRERYCRLLKKITRTPDDRKRLWQAVLEAVAYEDHLITSTIITREWSKINGDAETRGPSPTETASNAASGRSTPLNGSMETLSAAASMLATTRSAGFQNLIARGSNTPSPSASTDSRLSNIGRQENLPERRNSNYTGTLMPEIRDQGISYFRSAPSMRRNSGSQMQLQRSGSDYSFRTTLPPLRNVSSNRGIEEHHLSRGPVQAQPKPVTEQRTRSPGDKNNGNQTQPSTKNPKAGSLNFILN